MQTEIAIEKIVLSILKERDLPVTNRLHQQRDRCPTQTRGIL